MLLAHLVTTGLGPVYDGIGHFFLSPDDVIPALALSLLAGLRGKPQSRALLFQLPLAWFVGGLVGLHANLDLRFPPQCLSFMLIGLLIATDLPLPPLLLATLIMMLGFLHGFLNGIAMQPDGPAHAALQLLGIAATLFTLAAITSASAASLRAAWTRIVLRVAGSWIAAIGLLMLGWALRPVH